VRYCVAEALSRDEHATIDGVVFYDKPLLKFHRILETYLTTAPKGLPSFIQAIPIWLKEKLWIPPRIQESLVECGVHGEVPIHFAQHHESHAASAYYPSPFDEAAVLTLDGVGEWATTTIGVVVRSTFRTRSVCSIRRSPTSRGSRSTRANTS
jgi:carbamoyltransferase